MAHPPEKIEHFEAKLKDQQSELERSMLATVEQGREAAAEDTQDAVDLAVLSYQKEMLFSQGSHGHAMLNRVRAALARVEEGSYGECVNCEKTIGLARLEALPWTPHCIECQEKIEKGELQDAGQAA
ncbi:MAG TPA: TraR/DksA family transcriptional regulator [Acidisarcina sp.]